MKTVHTVHINRKNKSVEVKEHIDYYADGDVLPSTNSKLIHVGKSVQSIRFADNVERTCKKRGYTLTQDQDHCRTFANSREIYFNAR